MTSRYETRKQNILAQLGAPDGEYHDLSPKGSVDEPIRDLIGEINTLDGLVTTSSCSGRISVFLEGRKTVIDDAFTDGQTEARAGPGGKGGGGAWLHISHTPLEILEVNSATSYTSIFTLQNATSDKDKVSGIQSRYIHLKFEPMILHILTASVRHTQRVLTAALSAGFRESGAVSLGTTKGGDSTPMVAVRSTGYSFDSIVGYQDENGRNIALVDEQYLRTLVAIANDRFRINTERIVRFRTALMDIFHSSSTGSATGNKPEWENSDARRQRKREEGLVRQRALQRGASEAEDYAGDMQRRFGSDDGICR